MQRLLEQTKMFLFEMGVSLLFPVFSDNLGLIATRDRFFIDIAVCVFFLLMYSVEYRSWLAAAPSLTWLLGVVCCCFFQSCSLATGLQARQRGAKKSPVLWGLFCCFLCSRETLFRLGVRFAVSEATELMSCSARLPQCKVYLGDTS